MIESLRSQARGVQEETDTPEGSKLEESRKTLETEPSKSNPGAGFKRITWSKSLRKVILFWGHWGVTQEAPRDIQKAPRRYHRHRKDTQAAPRGNQEASRRHPGGTQEPLRTYPEGTQEAIRRYPEGPQEHPGDTRKHPGHQRDL